MTINALTNFLGDGWWTQIGLSTQQRLLTSRDDQQVQEAVLAVLHRHQPVAFVSDLDRKSLSLSELSALIDRVVEDTEQSIQQAQRHNQESLRHEVTARIETSYSTPGSDSIVANGEWAGFTQGEAAAWCWVLFQYEPHGFVHPGTQVRHEALQQLKQGTLPTVFGYPKRARELAATGMTPREFQSHKDALGAKVFDR